MSGGTELSLKNFFIFNANYGQKEGEEEKKILFFHPKDTKLDLQIKDVGLSEAIIKFSETFSSDPCEALQTEKTRRLFYQPEPNFWMVLTVNVATRRRQKDPLEVVEYLGSEVKNTVFSAVLRQAYKTARLFIGPFDAIVETNEGDVDVLRRKLNSFFDKYLMTLQLKNCDIMDVFQGVQFLPLDKKTFLHAQCFVNHVEASFPNINYSVLFYKEHLIWSGLNPEDAQVVYKYVTTCFRPPQRESDSRNQPISPSSARYLRGPTHVDGVKPSKLVFLGGKGFYHLVMFEVHASLLCLFIESGDSLTVDFYRGLDTVCREGLTRLAQEVQAYRGEAPEPTDEPNFIYFNSMNLATKSTLISKPPIHHSILVNMHDAHLRLVKAGCLSSETYAKTQGDLWVIGKLSNSREFYVILYRRKSRLKEVSDEVGKICRKYLKDIFFHV